MQTERQRILKGFNDMRATLDSEEKRVLQKLEEDEVNVLDNLVVARDQLARQKQCLRELISDIEHQIWGSSVDTVQVRLGLELHMMRFRVNRERIFSSLLGPQTCFLMVTFKALGPLSTYSVSFQGS